MSQSRSLLNGRPEPEVISNFQDGWSYSKGKMEEAFRNLFDKPAVKPAKETHSVKKDDVDLIVRELEIPRTDAERALVNAKGNLSEALIALITPKSTTAQ